MSKHNRKTGSARVLTSDECWSLMREKEDKKKKEAEEKEKRKEERENKRQEREEEKKQKAEERARKVEEREKKRKELEEQKAQKAAEKARKTAEKAQKVAEKAVLRSQKTATKRRNENSDPTTSESVDDEAVTGPDPNNRPLRKRPRVSVDSHIYSDLCCVCFGSYGDDDGTGREWLQCPCGRWIHQDCVVPSGSKDNKLCPIC